MTDSVNCWVYISCMTTAEEIGAAATRIEAIAVEIPALVRGIGEHTLRAGALRQAMTAELALRSKLAVLHTELVREMVDQIGATATARELGISRNRVYMLLRPDH